MHKPLSLDAVKEKIDYHSTVDDVALENEIVRSCNEYRRKLELGRKIKEIVLKNKIPTGSLYKDKMEALELFEKHGQVKEIKRVKKKKKKMVIESDESEDGGLTDDCL